MKKKKSENSKEKSREKRVDDLISHFPHRKLLLTFTHYNVSFPLSFFLFHIQGGGHSNIFSPPEEIKPHARPKYDQQNSSNLNFCMNTVDPNEKVTKVEKAPEAASEQEVAPQESSDGPQVSFSEGAEGADTGKSGAALPTYHHHRSTALW